MPKTKQTYKDVQLGYRLRAKPKFHPKGTKVFTKDPDGTDRSVVNGIGAPKNRRFHQKMYGKKGFRGHKVNPPTVPGELYPPTMSNKDRMKHRKEMREKAKDAKQTA